MAEAETAQEALALFKAKPFDVYVLDINLKDSSGLELLRRLRIERPGAKVVIFSMYSEVAYAMSARRGRRARLRVEERAGGGASGGGAEGGARGILRGRPDGARPCRRLDHAGGRGKTARPNRELEILRLLGEGKSLAEIADVLGIAYKTVANTSSRIKEKLGLDRTGDLIRLAVETLHTKVT